MYVISRRVREAEAGLLLLYVTTAAEPVEVKQVITAVCRLLLQGLLPSHTYYYYYYYHH